MFGPIPTPEPIPGESVIGRSIQLDMTHLEDTLVTFTWTADGDYAWYEKDDGVKKLVSWRPGCNEIQLQLVNLEPLTDTNPVKTDHIHSLGHNCLFCYLIA